MIMIASNIKSVIEILTVIDAISKEVMGYLFIKSTDFYQCRRYFMRHLCLSRRSVYFLKHYLFSSIGLDIREVRLKKKFRHPVNIELGFASALDPDFSFNWI